MSRQVLWANRRVPALLLKIGNYPLHSGGLAAIRTLGRLGVPVYATTEDPFTPSALSRYCAGRFRWRTTGREDPDELVAGLRDIGRRIGHRSVVVPADDEAAILIAEHPGELSEYFLFPRIQSGLPRQLASKHELYKLCRQHNVPVPASALVSTTAEVEAFASTATFPVVAKNAEPWVRHRTAVVAGTTVLSEPSELLALTRTKGEVASVLLQDYVPEEHAEDWIVHLYCDQNSDCLVLFTGVKVRSWPPHAGATACGYSVANPVLAGLTERFCKEIGFQGIADFDWRFDRRDGQYKLVDFNPRMGNQFRLFQTSAGIDVVRALYLNLTGRSVPAGDEVKGRRIVVEHIDVLARLAYRGSCHSTPSAPLRPAWTELAWLAADDPLPFLAMLPRLTKPTAAYLASRRQRRLAA